ncbi:MAG: efflux RND transporter permease subunit [Candidatus Devosia phytovorans]|uniref:Efflux RND transporter permease subunit n=1 Tax=Candidatus Devosia phytovorans TaxID=3121372 RepID=A0AAJ5VWE3_9HYPH|nr:efflux RND transporter permease subunit [Devosia sp.]WEK04727.1 MAG: efflux RND transporter permease subunit [Devosia sp.]
MSFTDLFIRRPILSVVVSLMILLVGGISLFSLPIRQYPNLESATITVNTAFPGATQEVMQGFVTSQISQAIATASGIEYLQSSSTTGMSSIKAKLVLNADADRAMTEILAKVQQIKYLLPQGVSDPVITKMTDGASAVQYIAFTSETMTVPQITDYITRVAQPLFTSINGVASAPLSGAQQLALRIWIDPDALSARDLTAGDVVQALRANNVQAAPGVLRSGQTVTNITASTDLTNLDDFRQMIIKSGAGGLVRLADVATLEIGGQSYDTGARYNGEQSVIVEVYPTPEGNPLDIVAASDKIIDDIQATAPPGLEIANAFDIAHFVHASISQVEHTLIEAVIIVVVVIFLFLGSMRAVIIPVVTIPLSLVGTAALMLAFGFSINLLTLLAMVLAIGLVVDDAIVVVENIHRHIVEGKTPVEAAILGAREIVGPVIAMTVTLAAVYAPIGMMGGLTGGLFREFAFTLAGSVVVSGVVALTLSPMMTALLINKKVTEGRLSLAVEHFFEKMSRGYAGLLDGTLNHRWAVLASAVIVCGATVMFFTQSQSEMAPPEDQGVVFTTARAPQYASLEYTSNATRQMDEIFARLPDSESSFFVDGIDGQNNSFGGVVLKDWYVRERSADDVQGQLFGKSAGILSTSITAFQPSALPAASGGLPFQLVLRSTADYASIHEQMEALKWAAWGSGLFAWVETDLSFDSPSSNISIDTAKAGELGVSMQTIADTLATLVGGNYVNRFNYYDRSYDVIPQVAAKDRVTPEDVGSYHVRTASGTTVPLSTIVTSTATVQANRLGQFNQMNAATLSGVLLPGATMGEAVEYMQSQPLSPGMSIDWLADSRQFVTEGNQLTVAFGLALVVIFLVLAAQYESFRDPFVILLTVPLALSGALVPLFLGFTTINIYTQIGLVTLIGLISKHGILMVAFANEIQVSKGYDKRSAIIEASAVRMRPILMTTAAMVTGLIPLVMASGAGSASRFAIGIVVVMGMLVGTLFTLFMLPTFYVLLAKDHRKAAKPAGTDLVPALGQ